VTDQASADPTGVVDCHYTPLAQAGSAFGGALRAIEDRAEAALGALEQEGRWAEALVIYASAGAEVDGLGIPRPDPAHRPARKLRAYLYLREANALRALGRHAEARPLADKELSAAIASGDHLSIARAMFSLGATCLANGERERGLKLLADSKPMFAHHPDDDHRQGLGWWHIVMAELSNEGLSDVAPQQALADANEALTILRPLKNWPGIARAHRARATALQRLGDADGAKVALTAAQMAQNLARLQTGPARPAP
jgi:tetratricopeptide (TPR) repeat protein